MKYDYDVENECFVREDGLGKKFWINSSEAHRIMTMYSLGNSIGEIRNKIDFVNKRRVTESTIVTFIKNVNDGNIVLDKDYPAPVKLVNDLTLNDRIDNLEERVTELEERFSLPECECEPKDSETKVEKVRAWLKL